VTVKAGPGDTVNVTVRPPEVADADEGEGGAAVVGALDLGVVVEGAKRVRVVTVVGVVLAGEGAATVVVVVVVTPVAGTVVGVATCVTDRPDAQADASSISVVNAVVRRRTGTPGSYVARACASAERGPVPTAFTAATW
jgi:hypothetical protein